MTKHASTRTPRQWDIVVLAAIAGVFAALSSTGCTTSSRSDRAVRATSTYEADRALARDAQPGSGVRVTPVVISEEPWAFSGREGTIIRTPHYRLFTTESDQILRQRMPVFLEHAIAHYRSAVVELPAPSQKLDTYLMDNRPQWEHLTQRLLGESGETLQQIQRGGYASRGLGVYFDIGLYDTLAIAAHEGWHQYTQRTFENALPIWLEEGLATYMEGHAWRGGVPRFHSWQNLERYDTLRAIVQREELIPLAQLLSERPTELLAGQSSAVLRYYAQVWAFTHFLIEGEGGRYANGLRMILLDAADGNMTDRLVASLGQVEAARTLSSRLGDGVTRVYLGVDSGELEEAYRAFILQMTARGARDAIASGRSPL